jgi:hypothetical protein
MSWRLAGRQLALAAPQDQCLLRARQGQLKGGIERRRGLAISWRRGFAAAECECSTASLTPSRGDLLPNLCNQFDRSVTGMYFLIRIRLTLHSSTINMLRYRLFAAILTISMTAFASPTQALEPSSPRFSPGVIATPQERAQLRSLPIEQRPNRPLHFYGNSVRRMQYRNAQQGLRIPPSRGATQPSLMPARR